MEVIDFESSPHAFLGVRPDWSLTGSVLNGPSCAFQLEHQPFRWNNGIWEADVLVTARRHDGSHIPRRVTLRVSPDTLRQWKELGIDPRLEACAQLTEHLRGASHDDGFMWLTLL